MDNQKFVEVAKKAVVDYFNSHKEITDEGRIMTKDVFVSWTCALSNRVLLKTADDEMRYEVFYEDDENIRVDVYKKYEKVDSECIKIIM